MKSTCQSPAYAKGLRAALLRHYDRRQRRLPWRGESDPYRVLVSEVMLQQTRVETVERYYGPWIEQFPGLASLAQADEDAVLKAWEGLGYYRRARNLHRAARIACDRLGGALPSSCASLKRLPGVGEYTAGAVASIAFGEPVPAVDGNVRRVLARLLDVPTPKRAWLRETAARMVHLERPGDWNQALMELGSTICRPRNPACGECPVARWCRARERGTQRDRPVPTAPRRTRRVTFVLVVLCRGSRVLVERRPPGGLLGGMWAFPEREVGDGGDVEAAALSLADAMGVRCVGSPRRLDAYEHRFTHLHATYEPCVLRVRRGVPTGADVSWIQPGAPIRLALPAAQRRLVDRLAERPA